MGSRQREGAKYFRVCAEEKDDKIRYDSDATGNISAHAGNCDHSQRSEKKTSRSSSQKRSPPDGGYGWFILLAAHCTLIFREGIAKCLGVFLPTFRTYFDVSTSMIGWISSLCVTFADFTGLVSGPLCRRFGCRPIAMAGGFFGGGGLVLASLTKEVGEFAICLSISGFGLGLSLTPSLTMVGHYFDKHYSMANGLSYAGSGVGILVLAPLAQVLMETYTWRGGLFLLGALCFHVVVCGALLRPLQGEESLLLRRKERIRYTSVRSETGKVSKGAESDIRPQDVEDVEKARKSQSNVFKDRTKYNELEIIEQQSSNDGACYEDPEDTKDFKDYIFIDDDEIATDNDDEEGMESRMNRFVSLLGLSLFKDVSFVILMIVQFCGRFVYMGWLIYLIPHAQEKGIAPLQSTLIASIAGVSNIIARAGHGVIVDRELLTAAQLLTIASFVASAPMLLDPVLDSYGSLMAASLIYGAASGVFFPIAVVVAKQSIGLERFPNALGWSYGFAGVGRMSAGFITGWLFDQFGSYNQAFILLGLIQTFASVLLLILLFISRRS